VKVKRIGFIGTRTKHVDEMTAFLRDVLGLEAMHTQPDWTISQLPSGSLDLAEVYGSDLRDERLLPNDVNAPMITFVVDDVVAAREEVAAAGIEILGDIVWAAAAFQEPAYEGIAWFFVRAPDGHVYGIQQARD
jgi:catechol 2,3-dioxygenase-like lactoylglutathione lyase family enzyme